MSYFTKEESKIVSTFLKENPSAPILCFKEKKPRITKQGKEISDKKYMKIWKSDTYDDVLTNEGKFADITKALKEANLTFNVSHLSGDKVTEFREITDLAAERYLEDVASAKADKEASKAEAKAAMEAAKDAMKLWIRLEQAYLDSKKTKSKVIKAISKQQKKILKDLHAKQKAEKKAEKEAEKAAKEAKKAAKAAIKAEKEAKKAEMEAKKAESDVEDAKSDVEDAKSDVEDTNSDVENAKSDVEDVKSDVEDAKSDVEDAKSDSEDSNSDEENSESEKEDLKTTLTIGHIKSLKVAELREILKSKNLSIDGKKKELVDRLCATL